jgi:MFS family permease
MFPRPLEGRYAAMVAVALLALVPYIVTTTADLYYQDQVARELATGKTALGVISALATACYAFGALLGGDLINRFSQRKLFLICEAGFVAGGLLAALAWGPWSYGAGRVLTGLATGLLLIISVPPLIRRFPASRLALTAVFINIGFFGAVTVGPIIGGLVAALHGWRLFYFILAGLAAAGWVLAIVALPDQEAANRKLPFDATGLGLGLVATILPFWAAGGLTRAGFRSALFIGPMVVGLTAFLALLVTEYRKKNALSPVKMMWTTFPVVGTLAAMVGGGASVTFLALASQLLLKVANSSRVAAGLLFWPQMVAVFVGAGLLGLLLASRYLPVLILAGMVALIGGGLLATLYNPHGSSALLLTANGLLGLGAGATVSPGLYLAGFSLPSNMVGRIFALVELVRSMADFILAPVMQQVARLASGGKTLNAAGIDVALWITIWGTLGLTIFGTALYLAARPRLPRPDLKAWLTGERTALVSPPLGGAAPTG